MGLQLQTASSFGSYSFVLLSGKAKEASIGVRGGKGLKHLVILKTERSGGYLESFGLWITSLGVL